MGLSSLDRCGRTDLFAGQKIRGLMEALDPLGCSPMDELLTRATYKRPSQRNASSPISLIWKKHLYHIIKEASRNNQAETLCLTIMSGFDIMLSCYSTQTMRLNIFHAQRPALHY